MSQTLCPRAQSEPPRPVVGGESLQPGVQHKRSLSTDHSQHYSPREPCYRRGYHALALTSPVDYISISNSPVHAATCCPDSRSKCDQDYSIHMAAGQSCECNENVSLLDSHRSRSPSCQSSLPAIFPNYILDARKPCTALEL